MNKSEPREPETLPFLVLGNKCDDEGLPMRKVSQAEASRFCEENNFLHFETSAKDNKNIEEGIRTLVSRVLERQERFNSKTLSEVAAGAGSRSQAVANNTNRRMNRSTKTRVVLNEQALSGAASQQEQRKNRAQCCKAQ
jgi:GTPase SAR1 family protein